MNYLIAVRISSAQDFQSQREQQFILQPYDSRWDGSLSHYTLANWQLLNCSGAKPWKIVKPSK